MDSLCETFNLRAPLQDRSRAGKPKGYVGANFVELWQPIRRRFTAPADGIEWRAYCSAGASGKLRSHVAVFGLVLRRR